MTHVRIVFTNNYVYAYYAWRSYSTISILVTTENALGARTSGHLDSNPYGNLKLFRGCCSAYRFLICAVTLLFLSRSPLWEPRVLSRPPLTQLTVPVRRTTCVSRSHLGGGEGFSLILGAFNGLGRGMVVISIRVFFTKTTL